MRSVEEIMADDEKNLSNAEVIRKAQITTANLSAGGELNPEQATRFISEVYEQTGLKGLVRTEMFDNKQKQIDKIKVGNRVLVAHTEGVDPGVRKGATTSKILLQPKEVMAPIEITDNFLRQNIEGKTIAERLVSYFAMQVSNNVEQFNLYADPIGPSQFESALIEGGSSTKHIKDDLLSLSTGWIRRADSANIYDAENSSDLIKTMANMKKKMPSQHKVDVSKLVYFMPSELEDNYRAKLGQRPTNLGDSAISGAGSMSVYGSKVRSLPLFDIRSRVVEEVTLSGTTAVSLRYKYIDKDEVWVTPSDLSYDEPQTPYVDTTDYVIEATGTIARSGSSSAISDGATVKVTYLAPPQILYTNPMNLIVAMNRDGVQIERQRAIYKKTWEFAISLSIDCQIQDLTGVVKGIHVKDEYPSA